MGTPPRRLGSRLRDGVWSGGHGDGLELAALRRLGVLAEHGFPVQDVLIGDLRPAPITCVKARAAE